MLPTKAATPTHTGARPTNRATAKPGQVHDLIAQLDGLLSGHSGGESIALNGLPQLDRGGTDILHVLPTKPASLECTNSRSGSGGLKFDKSALENATFGRRRWLFRLGQDTPPSSSWVTTRQIPLLSSTVNHLDLLTAKHPCRAVLPRSQRRSPGLAAKTRVQAMVRVLQFRYVLENPNHAQNVDRSCRGRLVRELFFGLLRDSREGRCGRRIRQRNRRQRLSRRGRLFLLITADHRPATIGLRAYLQRPTHRSRSGRCELRTRRRQLSGRRLRQLLGLEGQRDLRHLAKLCLRWRRSACLW
jgi:hypothetical protein